MGVDSSSTPDPRLTLSIPRAGINEVLRGWSGQGSIYESLACVATPDALDWTAADIQRRALRVLLGILDPISARWPRTAANWEEYLPSSSVSDPDVARVPAGSINWSETHRRSGWPPREFRLRTRRRVMDEVAIGTLAWLSGKLRAAANDVELLWMSGSERIRARLDVVDDALAPWSDNIGATRPDRLSLLSLRTSGYPWASVAAAAELALRAERDSEFIAFELITPDPDIGWRLFHLASYGMVIRALRNHRFVVTWRRPLSGTRPGAQIEAIGPSGTHYDLWFEAGALRGAYGLPRAAYYDAVRGIEGAGGAIGVDIMLIDKGNRALLFECKWSTNSQYVGRDGFHQSSSYALDALSGLASEVWSFVVGPSDIVPAISVAVRMHEQLGVVLGSTPPSTIGDVVSAFLSGEPNDLC